MNIVSEICGQMVIIVDGIAFHYLLLCEFLKRRLDDGVTCLFFFGVGKYMSVDVKMSHIFRVESRSVLLVKSS